MIKEFCNQIRPLASSRGTHEVFCDFCELSAIVLRQPFEKSPELEKRFHEILKPYPQNAADDFTHLLCIVMKALEKKPQDFLGECYHALELHNKYKGQFFTPYPVSQMMAKINLDGMKQHIEERGFFTLNEPTCGSGGMVVAAYHALRDKNINPLTSMWVVAQDIDYKCCCMTYIQMSFLAIPGVVIWGNSLEAEQREQWLTTGFYLYPPWISRLRKAKEAEVTQMKQQEESSPMGLFGQLEFEF